MGVKTTSINKVWTPNKTDGSTEDEPNIVLLSQKI